MPYALLTCEHCGFFYPFPREGEIEVWMERHMDPHRGKPCPTCGGWGRRKGQCVECGAPVAGDPHHARVKRSIGALCPYCRETHFSRPYCPSQIRCPICDSRAYDWDGRDRRKNCKVCGCPPGDIVSRLLVGREGAAAGCVPNRKRGVTPGVKEWNKRMEGRFPANKATGLADVSRGWKGRPPRGAEIGPRKPEMPWEDPREKDDSPKHDSADSPRRVDFSLGLEDVGVTEEGPERYAQPRAGAEGPPQPADEENDRGHDTCLLEDDEERVNSIGARDMDD